MTEGHIVIKWERLLSNRKLTDSKLLSVSQYSIWGWGDGSVDKVFAEQPQDLNLDSSTHLKFRLGMRWREADPGTESASSNHQLWVKRCYFKTKVAGDRGKDLSQLTSDHTHTRFVWVFLALMGIEPRFHTASRHILCYWAELHSLPTLIFNWYIITCIVLWGTRWCFYWYI